MNKTLENKLVEKYPSLFAERSKMVWQSLEINDGWFDIVDELFSALVNISTDITLSQVKQKFASLRVYLNHVPKDKKDDVSNLLAIAEAKSLETCKICGLPQEPDESNWFAGHRTTCMKRYQEIFKRESEDSRLVAKELFYANEIN